MKRFRWIVCLLALASIALFVQAASKNGLDSGDLIIDMDNGLTWVADSRYPLTVRAARSVVVPRTQGEEFVSRLNRGDFENFGYSDWRLPTTEELQYVARSAAFNRQVGDLEELKDYLGWLDGQTGISLRKNGDLVYAWPVRLQDDPPGGPPVEPSQRAILALNSTKIGRDSAVTGDIVTGEAFGDTLVAGFELEIDQGTTVDGSVRGDRVRVGTNATVTGDAEANTLVATGTIQGATSDCGPPCSLPALPAFFPAEGDLSSDQTVANNATLTLPAGDYGNIDMGRNSTVCFTGGIYNIKSITGGNGGNLHFDAPSDLRIEGKVEAKGLDEIGPSDCDAGGPAELPGASDIIFYISGINGSTGGLFEAPPAMEVGGTVMANFYVPEGTAVASRNAIVTGSFVARDVEFERDTSLTADSFFVGANQAPIADGQTVFADSSGETTIIITATDPEGGDLTFNIISGPTAPNSLMLTENPAPAPGDPEGCDPELEGDCITPPFPNRNSATVVFTGTGPDSFVFSATDTGGASGIATVFIDPDNTREDAPPSLAPDVSVSTPSDTPVSFNLRGNSGGTTTSSGISSRDSISARAIAISLASVGGSVEDTDIDGFGDVADANSEIIRAYKAGPVLIFSQDSNGNGLYRLDRFSGAATNLGVSGVTSSTVGLSPSEDPRVLYGSRFAGFTEINADGSGFSQVGSGAYEGLATDTATGTVYGVFNGNFGIVDTSTGTTVTALATAEFCDDGSEATCDIEGIAFGNGGVYGIVGDNGPNTGDSTVDDLFFYNPGTDSWSVVGPTGIDWDLVGLAYDPDQNLLYAKGSQDSNLYTINPSTGASSVVGDTGIAAGGGLALISRSPQESSSVGRVQIEVDASFCQGSIAATGFAASLQLAVAGSLSDATFLFAGTANQDEMLTASDFEAPVTMSGGKILAGDAVSGVSLDVTELVTAALSAPGSNGVFSISGRVDESGGGAAGLGIFSEASDNGPALVCSTPPPLPPLLEWTILSLPGTGTVVDAQSNPVMIGDTFIGPPEPVLTYMPAAIGVFTFLVQVEDLITMQTDISTVTISVEPDECTVVGRPVGCEPQDP